MMSARPLVTGRGVVLPAGAVKNYRWANPSVRKQGLLAPCAHGRQRALWRWRCVCGGGTGSGQSRAQAAGGRGDWSAQGTEPELFVLRS